MIRFAKKWPDCRRDGAPGARRISESEAEVRAGQGELRQAEMLFHDMRGFTGAQGGLRPDELIKLLGEYQALCVSIVKAHERGRFPSALTTM